MAAAAIPEHRDPGAFSGPLAGISFVASLVALNALAEARYPMPGADPPVIRRYFSREHRAARLGAVAQLICAGSLARFTRSVAATSLATSALTTVALTTARAERESDADALYRRMFVSGGPVHGVGLGLLVGSLGLAGLRTGELPLRLSKTALASSAAGALSPLALVAKPGLAFIPLGRLSALAVIGVGGVRLARAGS